MLQEAQRMSAPSAAKVSISTAVWIVMCRDPAMRAPFSGWLLAYCSRTDMRPGISVSAMAISLRPQSESPLSLTWELIATPLRPHKDIKKSLYLVCGDASQGEG